jgi:mono/diheme cytochrome c family protein
MSSRSSRTLAAVSTVVACGVILAACSSGGQPGPSGTPGFLDTAVAPRPAVSEQAVSRGRALYEKNCVQCHGERGDGAGYGAPFLVPAPRDFVEAQYKFRSTASGSLPSDEDLFRIISRGANGTGMPPWQYLLSDEDRWALVDYIKTFSPRFSQPNLVRASIELPPVPEGHRDAANGKQVYEKMQCAKCHGGTAAAPALRRQRWSTAKSGSSIRAT